MSFNGNIAISAADGWVLLTDADTTNVRFQNRGPGALLVSGTAGATAPTDDEGAIEYRIDSAREGERLVSPTDLFPGVAGATRLYGRTDTYVLVSVSHA
ncbi:MAG: hypothetical protein KJP02_02685 [Octadecabacter sp.]|nr:hypothetical protein [Octadecabacter sp.]